MNTFILIKQDGSEIQLPYTLKYGREFVTEHFSRAELDTGLDSEARFFEPLLQLLEISREKIGPITVNSGYRSYQRQLRIYQDDLKKNGGRPSGKVAKPGHSPHETGAAADLAVPTGYSAEIFAKSLRNISIELGFLRARTGWEKYLGMNFVHLDLVYMLYEPHINKKNPYPTLWLPGVNW